MVCNYFIVIASSQMTLYVMHELSKFMAYPSIAVCHMEEMMTGHYHKHLRIIRSSILRKQ